MTYEYLLPLPPRALSPNASGRSRDHWAGTKARAEYRELCKTIFAQHAPPDAILDCSVVLTMQLCRSRLTMGGVPRQGVPLAALDSYRPTDQDNATASLKGLMDGLQDARVIVTDRATHCHVAVEILEVATHQQEGVRVEVKQLKRRR